jgi:pterin-4a-carbinolamine dehydratase
MFTMSETAKEKTYSEAENKARLQQELPRWIYEGGWIRRTYKTASWKGTLMVINTIGHLAEAAWHHPDLTASYAVEVSHSSRDQRMNARRFWGVANTISPVARDRYCVS